MHMLKFYLVNTGNRHFITSNESATGEPLIMLEGCTLSNTVKPEHVSGFTVWGEQRAIAQIGFAPIFPDICYHLTHYKPAAADIPVASDNPAHYADAIRYNAR
ncbi:hypothetical protein ODZ10_24190, partial [Escherichia coli]|nr:hypothetical protein [Escherichia coli]